MWDDLDDARAVTGIERQIASGEVAQSWLLLGPRGSGKGAVSKAMAAALTCPREPTVGCGRCWVCARIARRRHPDVHHIVPEGPLIAVDVIRESVIPEASRSPFEGERKVFILEEAERMNEPAQNALLKTLEEPQLDTAFILMSEAEEEVLETIRSRCRIVRLEAVPEARVVELLEAEGANHDDAVVAARVSEGDLEAARSLAFDASLKARRRAWLGVPGRLESPVDALDAAAEILDDARRAGKEHEREQKRDIQELSEAMGEGRGTATARNSLVTRHKREARRLEDEILGDALRCIASFYRDVVAARHGAAGSLNNPDSLDATGDWAASGVSDAGLLSAAQRLVEARGSLLKNANPALTLEAALLDAARLAPPPQTVGAPPQ